MTRWLVIAVLAAMASTAAADPAWDKRAKATPWSLDQAATTLDWVMRVDKYDFELDHRGGEWSELDVRVKQGARLVYLWKATSETPLVVQGDTLYYVVHQPSASGAKLVAVDLATSKERWTTALVGLGPQAHSKYRNQVSLAVVADAVIVQGEESHGRYVELVDPKTGKTLATDRRK